MMSKNCIDSMFQLQQAIHAQVKNGFKEVDVLRWATRTSFELISQGGLGRSFDPLVELPDPSAKVFGEALKELMCMSYSLSSRSNYSPQI